MAEYEDGIFSNLPQRRRRPVGDRFSADADNTRSFFREALGMYVPEGPLPPRPERSGKGGPSINQGAAPPPVTSVWSAADATANGMTLTNGGLTVTPSGAASWQSIRSSVSKTSSQLYVEFKTSVAVTSADIAFGLANSGFVPGASLGDARYGNSAGIYPSENDITTGFISHYVTSMSIAANDVWALAVDFAAGNVWIGQNNVWANASSPATGALPILSFTPTTVGALFAAMTFNGANVGVWTLQSTPAQQKYLPPPGFQAWDGGPVTPNTSVWSAADATANGMTLTNGGLTFAMTTTPYQSIRGTISRSSGKYYVEFLNVVAPNGANNFAMGLADAGFVATNYLGSTPNSLGIYGGGTQETSGFTVNFTLPSTIPAANDVLALAVDFTAGKIWIALNNSWFDSGNPASGTGEFGDIAAPAFGLAYFPALTGENAVGKWTLQATAASQKYAPPSGFTPWDSAAPTHSPQALAYLARTVGGNEGGNGTNIATLIDGLVSDGVWANLDCLYVLAQQNSTDARLNLVSASYPLTGSATFTLYQGFSAFPNPGLDSGFNATSVVSPQFVLNSGSVGAWTYNTPDAKMQIGTGATSSSTSIIAKYTDSKSYFSINSANGSSGVSTPGGGIGLVAGDRSGASTMLSYWNGVNQGSDSVDPSTSLENSDMFIGGPTGWNTAQTLSAAFIGASLGSAGQLALYNRLRTYMTAVGVP